MKTIGFIGLGKMATAIISSLNQTENRIIVSGRDAEKTRIQAEKLGIHAIHSHQELVKTSDIIILAVKPQMISTILSQITDSLTADKVLVSIAASLTLEDLSDLIKDREQPLIRVMPNINAQIGQSTSAMVSNSFVSQENQDFVKSIFLQVGTVHDIAEKDFSAFTALAGSSPAYIYMFIDALSRAGVLHGLPKEEATRIVAETVKASAEMVLESEENPWSLVDKVSSPAGSTVAGVVSLEQNKFVGTVIDAITATIEKEKKLK